MLVGERWFGNGVQYEIRVTVVGRLMCRLKMSVSPIKELDLCEFSLLFVG